MDYSDLYNSTKEITCLVPQTLTADTNCTAVDLGKGGLDGRNFRSVMFLISLGADASLSGANYWTIELEDSDDNSTFADVTTAGYVDGNVEDLTGGACFIVDATTEDETTLAVQYTGPKRYARIVMNETGTITGTPVSVVGLLSGARHKPI